MASFRVAQAIRLQRDCIFTDGAMLKAGHVGVVLDVHPPGENYQVKFVGRAMVEKMRADELEPYV